MRSHKLIFVFLMGLFLSSCLAAYSMESSALNLVNIKELIRDAVIELPYATTENFTGTVLYSKNSAYLLKPVAEALASAAIQLRAEGYRIKVSMLIALCLFRRSCGRILPTPNLLQDRQQDQGITGAHPLT